MSNWFVTIFTKIDHFFKSPAAEQVATDVEEFTQLALPIVQDLNVLAPNKTLGEINTITTKYGLPAITAIASDPAAAGNTLLNLATTILQKNLPASKATASTAILNTAVQIAVLATKNGVTSAAAA